MPPGVGSHPLTEDIPHKVITLDAISLLLRAGSRPFARLQVCSLAAAAQALKEGPLWPAAVPWPVVSLGERGVLALPPADG